jgi:hypothetical protein
VNVRKYGGPGALIVVIGVVIVVVFAACSSSDKSSSEPPAGNTTVDASGITVVSSRPDMISGGDALLDIPGEGTPTVEVDGKALTVTPVDTWWLVAGIPDGPARLEVKRGDTTGAIDVVGHPIVGPVFSGPHMPLLACTTEDYDLGTAIDADCSAPTKVDYLYPAPTGLTTVAEESAAPTDAEYVVKRERGTINRAVYWIDTPTKTWNKRLVYRFGGGCGTTFGQGGLLGTTADAADFLKLGYAVATATFNTFQTQCNDVLSSETAMMVKEHFIEENGVPVHTIGEGASGGAIQIHLTLQNYPGILDAAVALLPFPDAITIAPGVSDCGLLNNYYKTPAGSPLTPEQRAAINGHAVPGTCRLWEQSFLEGIRPSDGCNAKIPKSEIYDPTTNPDGLRCDLVDANINTLGTDPGTGFANRPLDNIGVQYGLEAVLDQKITVDQFLDLNAAVGGYDVDGKPIPERHEATEESLRIAYAKGRVAQGGGDLEKVPLIDLNIYQDVQGDIHDRFRAFSLRERLEHSPNHVIWTRGGTGDVIGNIISGGGGSGNAAVPMLDQWLDAGERPADAIDNCPGANNTFISGTDIYDTPGPCRDDYPLHDDPRTAAGAPLRNDILKCRLQPVDPGSYGVELSEAQVARLQQIFPDGVCDWTQPGVGQVPLEGTWLTY